MVFVFDVDGTLTPPRAAMHDEFAATFLKFCTRNAVYLASGSDRFKLEGQIPTDILASATGLFTCGASVFEAGGRIIYSHDHEFPDELVAWLDQRVGESKYPSRCGRHIEYRTGQLNMSTIGRSASAAERKAYSVWDQVHGERTKLCAELMIAFPEYEAVAGGEISIDISPTGWSKARALIPIQERHGDVAITFIGDKIKPGCNDWHLAESLRAASSQHVIVPVRNWLETAEFVRRNLSPLTQSLSA